MSTIRDDINSLRDKLKERTADTVYTNWFLYKSLLEQSKWLIKREIQKGYIYKNTTFFQTLKCQKVIEVPIVESCCPVDLGCKIYRTEEKLPETWIDNNGPIIKLVTSIDNSTDLFITTLSSWISKRKDPYRKMASIGTYSFYSDGYLWFPEVNPHRVNILAYFKSDVSKYNNCDDKKDCISFLDTQFLIPDWVEAECIIKTLEEISGSTKRFPQDTKINKDPNK